MGASKSQKRAILEHKSSLDEPKFIQLPDGRKLAFEEYGSNSAEKNVIFFHGDPGSRLFFPFGEKCKEQGLRIWSLERPGFGESSPHPERDFNSNTRDVQDFINHFHLENVVFMGYSAGGPYALSAASNIECESCVIISSLAPPTVPKAWTQMTYLGCIGWCCVSNCTVCIPCLVCLNDCSNTECFSCSEFDAEKKIYDLFEPLYHKQDLQDLKENQLIKLQFVRSMLENENSDSYHQTEKRELQLFGSQWLHILQEISCPVYQYVGDLDKGCVPKFAKYLEENIPNCKTYSMPDKGHLAFFYFWDQIANEII